MANDTERLVISLEARVRDFERNMAKAARTGSKAFDDLEARAKQSAGRMEQAMSQADSRVGGSLKNFASGFAGGFVAGGLEGIVSQIGQIAKGIASVGDEAKRAGLSNKAFQELKFVADQNRVSVDALTDGMKELSLRADEFIDTGSGSAAEAFRTLGLSAADLKVKLQDPSALFTEIIGKMEKLDKASQIRVADELFGGTGGEQFVQLLDQGEEGIKRLIQRAHETGAVMSDEMIAKAAELDRKFSEVSMTVGSALKGAIIEAYGALQDFMNLFSQLPGYRSQEATDKGIAAIQSGVNEQAQNDQRENHLRQIKRLQDTITKNNELGFDNADAQNKLRAEQDRLRALDEMINRQKALNEEKEKTLELDTVTVPGSFNSDDKGNYREFQQIPLPNSVNTTPNRRVDPYFEDPSSGANAGAKATEATVVTFIKKFEGFISKAKWDVNAFRVGYGSDTTTRAGGAVEKVTSSTVVSLADANRDLARRIAELQTVIKGQIGGETWASFGEEQQAALTSVAYNYGSLPNRIVEAILKGHPNQVGTAIRNLGDDNGGINRKRRAEEADLFFSGSGSGNTPAMEAATSGLKQQKQAATELQQQYDALGQSVVGVFNGIASALQDGKIDASELVSIVGQLIQAMLSMPSVTGQNAGGGSFGSILGGLFGIFGGGGGTDPWAGLRLAGGGHVRGPGTSTSDSIPAALSNGEFVVNARQTAKHRALLEAINDGSIRPFAAGGLAGKGQKIGVSRMGNQTFAPSVTVNMNSPGGDPKQNRDQAKAVREEIEQLMDQKMAEWSTNQMRPGGVLTRKGLNA